MAMLNKFSVFLLLCLAITVPRLHANHEEAATPVTDDYWKRRLIKLPNTPMQLIQLRLRKSPRVSISMLEGELFNFS